MQLSPLEMRLGVVVVIHFPFVNSKCDGLVEGANGAFYASR